MTVRELITKLADYPPDAEVHIADNMGELEDAFLPIVDNSTPKSARCPNKDDMHWADCSHIFIGAVRTNDNAFRRGALEQLFDGCSTGEDGGAR
jgi:hypothetical protein